MFASIGIIGSGPVGRAVATRSLTARIPVVLSNSRGPDTLTHLVDELGEGASAGSVAQAADADLVVVAIPFVKVPKLSAAVPDWSGRVVVDATISSPKTNLPTPAWSTSAMRPAANGWPAPPGATVIKAFKQFAEYIMADPQPRWTPSALLRRRQ